MGKGRKKKMDSKRRAHQHFKTYSAWESGSFETRLEKCPTIKIMKDYPKIKN